MKNAVFLRGERQGQAGTDAGGEGAPPWSSACPHPPQPRQEPPPALHRTGEMLRGAVPLLVSVMCLYQELQLTDKKKKT